MVKASGQIEKELGLLQQRTEDMSTKLDSLYDGYLKALGAASAQQLMSAVYHLCTQAYPDKFLALSWKQRNQLQTALQTLAAQIQVQLGEQRSQVKKNSRKPSKSSGLAFLQRLLEARSAGTVIHTHEASSEALLDKLSEMARSNSEDDKAENVAAEDSAPPEDSSRSSEWDSKDSSANAPAAAEIELASEEIEALSLDAFDSEDTFDRIDSDSAAAQKSKNENENDVADISDSDKAIADDRALTDDFDFEMDVPAAEQRLSVSDEEELLGALEALARRSADEEENDPESPLAPIHLMKQQMLMEKAIADVFKAISEATNELLQKAGVMPNFPKALMAAAADTRGFGEPVNSVPNVVKVSVRVMHGQANFEDLDFDANDDLLDESGKDERASEPDPKRDPKQDPRQDSKQIRKMWSDSRRNNHYRKSGRRPEPPKNKRNGRESDDRRQGRREGRSDEMRSRRQDPRSPRPFISSDAIEIEAFPEFAVINLQLSEVEFADPGASVWRGRLRQELSHLKKLGRRYKKTQKSLETAQAEDAWRSSWTSLEES